MVILGIDAHKRSHTVVVVDEQGRQLASEDGRHDAADHLALLAWAAKHGSERLWAVEDCRHLSRRLERDLLAAGERIVRVPPKLMANARDSARSVRQVRPDRRAGGRPGRAARARPADRAARRARARGAAAGRPPRRPRRRANPHDQPAALAPARARPRAASQPLRSLNQLAPSTGSPTATRSLEGTVARLARELVEPLPPTDDRDQPARARDQPRLSQTRTVAAGRSAAAARSPPRRSSARPPASTASAPTTPTPATTAPRRCPSGHRTAHRHRLSRSGNRQLNAALHRIALTQAHSTPAPSPDRPPPRQRRRRPRSTPHPQTTPLRRRLPRPPRRRHATPPHTT